MKYTILFKFEEPVDVEADEMFVSTDGIIELYNNNVKVAIVPTQHVLAVYTK